MSGMSYLRRQLHRVHVQRAVVEQIIVALELTDHPDECADALMGLAQALACEYHARKTVQAMERQVAQRPRPWLPDVAGGPQNDPGDDTPSMFD